MELYFCCRVALFLGIVGGLVNAKVLLNSTTGGYTGLVVALDKDAIGTNDVNTLLENLKDLLTRASETLHRATHGRLFFQHVTILLPVDDQIEKLLGIPIGFAESGEVYALSDIRVSGNASTDFLPRTTRRGDCGEPADFIQLTSGYLMHTNNVSFAKRYGDPAKEFVKQWGQFRFGLFNENDPTKFYFHPEHGAFEAAYCANSIVNGSRRNSDTGLSCAVNEHLMPSKECRFYLSNVGNDNVTSSLLFASKLAHIVEFCNETTHNRYAPTMQNLRCQGSSAWEVMHQHTDFSNQIDRVKSQSTFSPPEFHLVNSNLNTSLVVIIIDLNIFTKNESTVSDPVVSSLRKYVLFGVPDGTTLELSFVNETDHTFPLHMTIQNYTDRIVILEAIDFLLFNDTSSFIVHDDNDSKVDELENLHNGVVMFVVGTANLTPGKWLRDRLLGAHFAPVFVNITPDDALVRMADETDGNVYVLRGGRFTLEVDLDAVFLDATDRFTDAHDIVQISSGVMRTTGNLPNSFLVDLPVVKYLKVVVSVILFSPQADYPSDPTRQFLAKEAVVVVSPTNIYGDVSAQLMAYESSTESRSFIDFQLTDAQPGSWSLRRGPGYFPENTIVIFQVFAVLPGHNELRSMSAVTSLAKVAWQSAKGVPMVPRLTVSLMQCDRMYMAPTTTTNVTARIYPPNGRPSYLTVLRDGGKGADVIAGDGVYSVFLTNITDKGIYKVVPVVYGGDGLACLVQRSADCFQRSSSILYYEVKRSADMKDFEPPCSIMDLFLIDARRDGNGTIFVSLNWTAPGDDFDQGTAAGYDVRYFNDWSAARHNFTSGKQVTAAMVARGSNATTLTAPKPAGSVQVLTVKLPSPLVHGNSSINDGSKKPAALFVAMRAFDTAGNLGRTSNIVNVPVFPTAGGPHPTTMTTGEATVTTPVIDDDGNATSTTTATPLSNVTGTSQTHSSSIKNSHAHDGVIASAILLFLALTIMSAVCIHMRYFSKKDKRNNQFAYEEFNVGERVASRIEH